MGYFELRKSSKDTLQPYYFVLKSSNHEVIAQSEMYSSKQGAKNGIASVQQNGSSTDIRDETSVELGELGLLARAARGY